jgi:DNA-binding NarL/FixJ family response regulator
MKAGLANRVEKIRILVVDELPVFRFGLAKLINAEPDLLCCAETNKTAAIMELVQAEHPRVTLLELHPESPSDLSLVQSLRSRFPTMAILAMLPCDLLPAVEQALRAGVRGYLHKDEPAAEVLQAIRVVLRGEQYLSRKIAAGFLRNVSEHGALLCSGRLGGLTDRELQIFRLLGANLGLRRIAAELNLSIKTVEAHRESIKHKLGLSNAASVVNQAIQWINPNVEALPRIDAGACPGAQIPPAS